MERKQTSDRFKENAWALKPIAICLVIIFIAVGIAVCFTAIENDNTDEIQQTEEYKMALEYLQKQPDIIDQYGSELPTCVGRSYGEVPAKRYVFTFVYNYVPIINWGDRYKVELNYIDGQWTVIGIVD